MLEYQVHEEEFMTNPPTHAAWIVTHGGDQRINFSTHSNREDAEAEAKFLNDSCSECGAGPYGRCQLEGEGECPEGCITPEQW